MTLCILVFYTCIFFNFQSKKYLKKINFNEPTFLYQLIKILGLGWKLSIPYLTFHIWLSLRLPNNKIKKMKDKKRKTLPLDFC